MWLVAAEHETRKAVQAETADPTRVVELAGVMAQCRTAIALERIAERLDDKVGVNVGGHVYTTETAGE